MKTKISAMKWTATLNMFFTLLTVSQLIGCGDSRTPSTSVRADTQTILNNALQAHDQQDYQRANDLFDQAWEGSGLNPDQLVELYLSRAVARGHLQRFVEAHEDLDQAAMGPADPARVWVTRSLIFKLEGKPQDAKAAFSKARTINPKIKPLKR